VIHQHACLDRAQLVTSIDSVHGIATTATPNSKFSSRSIGERRFARTQPHPAKSSIGLVWAFNAWKLADRIPHSSPGRPTQPANRKNKRCQFGRSLLPQFEFFENRLVASVIHSLEVIQ